MQGIFLIGLGLLSILFGSYFKKNSGKKLSVGLNCLGAVLIILGIVLFFLVAADILQFPLN